MPSDRGRTVGRMDKNGDRWTDVITRIFWSVRADSELVPGWLSGRVCWWSVRPVGGGQCIQSLVTQVHYSISHSPTSREPPSWANLHDVTPTITIRHKMRVEKVAWVLLSGFLVGVLSVPTNTFKGLRFEPQTLLWQKLHYDNQIQKYGVKKGFCHMGFCRRDVLL